MKLILKYTHTTIKHQQTLSFVFDDIHCMSKYYYSHTWKLLQATKYTHYENISSRVYRLQSSTPSCIHVRIIFVPLLLGVNIGIGTLIPHVRAHRCCTHDHREYAVRMWLNTVRYFLLSIRHNTQQNHPPPPIQTHACMHTKTSFPRTHTISAHVLMNMHDCALRARENITQILYKYTCVKIYVGILARVDADETNTPVCAN